MSGLGKGTDFRKGLHIYILEVLKCAFAYDHDRV